MEVEIYTKLLKLFSLARLSLSVRGRVNKPPVTMVLGPLEVKLDYQP